MTKVGLRHVALAGLLSFGLIGTAFAQPPATGLGQSWPNANDVSAYTIDRGTGNATQIAGTSA